MTETTASVMADFALLAAGVLLGITVALASPVETARVVATVATVLAGGAVVSVCLSRRVE